MQRQDNLQEHIVDFLLGNKEDIHDPVILEWLSQSDSNKAELNLYKKIWEESSLYSDPDSYDKQRAWDKIDRINKKNREREKRLRRIKYISSAVAALLILFALSLSLSVIFKGKNSPISVSMSADYGNRSEITLPDGSLVRLNSGSDIAYTFDPRKKTRNVSFQGEGFFDVAKSEMPFEIKTSGGVVLRVKGTSFNLQAYDDDSFIQTSLIDGCVELSNGDETILMKPGEIAMFDKNTREFKRVNGDLSHSYGWLNNKLYMDDMPLSTVCKYLERWYGVDIEIEAGLGGNIHFNGVIQEETVEDVLDAMASLSSFSYSKKGKHILITSK